MLQPGASVVQLSFFFFGSCHVDGPLEEADMQHSTCAHSVGAAALQPAGDAAGVGAAQRGEG